MTIYDRIKELRIKKGLSQGDLAKLVGYQGRSAISKVEQGQRNITQTMIKKYAIVLDTTPQYLLFGEEKSSTIKVELNESEKRFIDIIRQMSVDEASDVLQYMQFVLSRRK